MTDPDRLDQQFDAINADLSAIRAKLNRMPTTRECWAFVLGFAMATALVIGLAVFAKVAA